MRNYYNQVHWYYKTSSKSLFTHILTRKVTNESDNEQLNMWCNWMQMSSMPYRKLNIIVFVKIQELLVVFVLCFFFLITFDFCLCGRYIYWRKRKRKRETNGISSWDRDLQFTDSHRRRSRLVHRINFGKCRFSLIRSKVQQILISVSLTGFFNFMWTKWIPFGMSESIKC